LEYPRKFDIGFCVSRTVRVIYLCFGARFDRILASISHAASLAPVPAGGFSFDFVLARQPQVKLISAE
jgi:hypothetical protein